MKIFLKRLFKFSCLIVLCLMVFCSCSFRDSDKDNDSVKSTENCKLIYEQTTSPNENYVTSDEDTVKYTIQVFQNKDNHIIINANSNSEFFNDLQYTIAYDETISKDGVDVKWTTLMGNPDATEKDQLGIAYVSIFSNNNVISERKIDFVKGAIEIITETISQNSTKD